MRIISAILSLLILSITGCANLRKEPNKCKSVVSDQTQYLVMHDLIAKLTPAEYEIFKSFFSTVFEQYCNSSNESEYRFDNPEYIEENKDEYRDGYCSGYAYFMTKETTLQHSMMREKNSNETAYLQGWYDGQIKALSERLQIK